MMNLDPTTLLVALAVIVGCIALLVVMELRTRAQLAEQEERRRDAAVHKMATGTAPVSELATVTGNVDLEEVATRAGANVTGEHIAARDTIRLRWEQIGSRLAVAQERIRELEDVVATQAQELQWRRAADNRPSLVSTTARDTSERLRPRFDDIDALLHDLAVA